MYLLATEDIFSLLALP